MRRTGRRSENVEDRRGMRIGGRGLAGGGLGALVLVVIALALGVDPMALFEAAGPQLAAPSGGGQGSAQEDELADFVSLVLADTEDTWTELFRREGRAYEPPRLVLFSEAVRSGCGLAGADIGPFYCPADRRVYLDLGFFDELERRFGAPGDFAQAYVVAHEVGHHVQALLGISDDVHARQRGMSEEDANRLSVRLELQADFLAGVWAHHAERSRQVLERGDVEEALGAAAAIGDDRLQRQARGEVRPDSFTHGTSAQRARWFRRGLETGRLADGDTFSVPDREL